MLVLPTLLAIGVVPAGQSFECTPVRVWDGDGPIWCAEGPRIRVAGIAAREIDGSCYPYQPCPKIGPQRSRDALAALVGVATGKSAEGHVFGHWANNALQIRRGCQGQQNSRVVHFS